MDVNRNKNNGEIRRDVIPNGRSTVKEEQLKFLIIGDFGVGKTAIVRRYVDGRFSSNYKITIGADFTLKTIMWDDKTRINVQLWDIAGHERFGYMTRVYYKYAVGAAVVFDLTRSATIHSVTKWLQDLREKVTLADGTAIPVVLMANKCDVSSAVPVDLITRLCREYSIDGWFPTSAKENFNIEKAFSFLIGRSLQTKVPDPISKESIILNQRPIFDKKIYNNSDLSKMSSSPLANRLSQAVQQHGPLYVYILAFYGLYRPSIVLVKNNAAAVPQDADPEEL